MEEFVVLKPVENDYDVESLRVVRNECRNYMTRNTNLISFEQQKNWWNNLDKENMKLFLLHKVVCGVAGFVIGYGVIRIENGEVLLTGGLNQTERGKGHGKQLFNYLVENSKQYKLPIKLELLKSNTRAFDTYKSIGFVVIGEDETKIYMEYQYDSVI